MKITDVTSYSRNDKTREPRSMEIFFEKAKIKCTVHRHIHYPGTWLLTARDFGIEQRDLNTDNFDEAVSTAKSLVKKAVISQITKLEWVLQEIQEK